MGAQRHGTHDPQAGRFSINVLPASMATNRDQVVSVMHEQKALVRFPASVGIWDRVSPDPGLNLSLEDRSRFRRALKALKARPVSLSSWAPRDRHVGSLPGQADPSLRHLNSIVPSAPRLQLSHYSCIDGDRLQETREVCANLARFIGPLDR